MPSLDNRPGDYVPHLGGRVIHYYVADNAGTDEGIDDPLVAGRLHIDLTEAEDIEGKWPLHASVEGERTFRTVTELDTLINDLQELRAEWINLTTDAIAGDIA